MDIKEKIQKLNDALKRNRSELCKKRKIMRGLNKNSRIVDTMFLKKNKDRISTEIGILEGKIYEMETERNKLYEKYNR